MSKRNLREELINTILIKNGNDDDPNERAYLKTLSLIELKVLAYENDNLEYICEI